MPSVAALRGRARRQWSRARLPSVSRRVLRDRLTYLSPRKLQQLDRCLRTIDREGVPGQLIEAGVALGGSAIILASRGRDFAGYDVFGMIPPPGERDPARVHERYAEIASGTSAGIGGDPYYGYSNRLYDEVVERLERYGVPLSERVRLHRGLFEQTLHPDGAVALAHVDCDWYEPVKLSLERIHPRLAVGGFLVIDDYYDYDGARLAVHEAMARHPDLRVEPGFAEHLVLRRTSGA